jgi:hypothetical protein
MSLSPEGVDNLTAPCIASAHYGILVPPTQLLLRGVHALSQLSSDVELP